RLVKFRMLAQALAPFPGEVQAGKTRVLLLDHLCDAQDLGVVCESAVRAHQLIERFFAGVTKRRMTKVVSEGNCFSEVLVEAKSAGDGAANRGVFDRVRQPCAKMIARAVEEDLSLVFEAAECLGVNDPSAVAFVFRPMRVGRFRVFAPG